MRIVVPGWLEFGLIAISFGAALLGVNPMIIAAMLGICYAARSADAWGRKLDVGPDATAGVRVTAALLVVLFDAVGMVGAYLIGSAIRRILI
jgi:hypothetical protein